MGPLASLFKPKKPPWPNPAASTGTFCWALGRYRCWNAVGPAGDIPEKRGVFGEIGTLLKSRHEYLHEGESIPRPLSYEIYMVGRLETDALPHILFICESKRPRQRALKLVRESGILDGFPGLQLGECSRSPMLSQPVDRIAFDQEDGMLHATESVTATARDVYYRPPLSDIYGFPIFVASAEAGHVRMATVGGLTRVGETLFALTAAHTFCEFHSRGDISELPPIELSLELENEEDGDLEQNDFIEMTSRGSQSTERFSFDDSTSSAQASFSTHADQAWPTAITPRLSTFVNELATNNTASVPVVGGALSLLGKLSTMASESEQRNLDWALVSIDQTKISYFLQCQNPICIQGTATEIESPISIKVLTASNRVLCGTLFNNPVYMQLPPSRAFQKLWVVQLEGPLKKGDCGSWIVDYKEKTLYGYITAGDSGSSVAYIVPAHQAISDIAQQMRCNVMFLSVQNSGGKAPLITKRKDTRGGSLKEDKNRSVTPAPSKFGIDGSSFGNNTTSVPAEFNIAVQKEESVERQSIGLSHHSDIEASSHTVLKQINISEVTSELNQTPKGHHDVNNIAVSAITEAFEKLRRSISNEDARVFSLTSIENVLAAVEEIQFAQMKQRSIRNLSRLQPLLKGIQELGHLIGAMCPGPSLTSYLWAPIRLMLQLASQHRDVFEALLSAYAEIGAALPNFDRHGKVFFESPELQEVLATIYCGILEFHQRSYKFFRRRAWHIIFLSLWKDFGGRFGAIVYNLKKQRDFVDRETTSLHIAEVKGSLKRSREDFEQNTKTFLDILEEHETDARIARLRHAVAWLSVEESDQQQGYERSLARRHVTTCKWILSDTLMKQWISDDSNNPILWLTGKPGAGKSVICSYVIEKLLETPGIATCYYFCTSQEKAGIPTRILRIIGMQLLRQNPDLATLISNEFVYKGMSCTSSQMRVLIPKLLEITGSTRIIIDGLDECSSQDQRLVLEQLQTLCQRTSYRCKIIFASRRELLISRELYKMPNITLGRHFNLDSDIHDYVRSKMAELPTENQALLERIEMVLVEKSDGMFLWARLVIDELKQCYSEADLEEVATTIPTGLDQVYQRMLDKILGDHVPKKTRSLAMRILECMACSHRVLKTHEILDLIAFRPGCTTLDNKTKIRKEVLDLCQPLIEEGPSNTVNFVHYSARIYILDGHYRGIMPLVFRENAMLTITFSCVAYLNTSKALLPESSTDQERAAMVLSGFHGLQTYANTFWLNHLLEYSDILTEKKAPIPEDLTSQLKKLLEFRKDPVSSRVDISLRSDERFEVFNTIPEMRDFISTIISFRADLRNQISQKSPQKPLERILSDSYVSDPTYLTSVRLSYQTAVETLLSPKAFLLPINNDSNALQNFAEVYGQSAFVCRQIDCVHATDGFDSPQKRDKHESLHGESFLCSYSDCSYFNFDFARPNLLKRHIDKWHAPRGSGNSSFDDQMSLDFNTTATGMQQRVHAPMSFQYPTPPQTISPTSMWSPNSSPMFMPSRSGGSIPLLESSLTDAPTPTIVQSSRFDLLADRGTTSPASSKAEIGQERKAHS